MLTHLDWSSHWSWTLSHADWSLLLSIVDCQRPLWLSLHQLLLWILSSNSSLAFPCLLPVASRSRAQAFVWFCAKTDKGIVCLADHPHSVTHQVYLCRGARLLSQRMSGIWHKTIRWRGFSNAGALGNVEYSFIAIAPKFTLIQIGCTW